jgi:O-methyltransferase involved in polyketide biosynthesis
MRAWRLPWPPGFRLFEVDSATVLSFKARVLDAAGAAFRESLKVDRVEVVADAAQPEGGCHENVDAIYDSFIRVQEA